MAVASLEFLIFLACCAAVYYLAPQRIRWVVLLVASYLFYLTWGVYYVLLLLAQTLSTYWFGLRISATNNNRSRKLYLTFGILAGLAPLVIIKYFNFFMDSLQWFWSKVGIYTPLPNISILLFAGISFYTFHAVAYLAAVFRKSVVPERHLGRFALFLGFFPYLLAGPIERPQSIMPQLHKLPGFDESNIVNGLRLILWGLFKKLAIADRLGGYTSTVLTNYADYSGVTVLFAIFLFGMQIYTDFSAYSDIARGGAKLFGVELMLNFKLPYFATSVGDFWQRWHISLTTFFRENLYFPLGGSRKGLARTIVNTLIVFTVSGLWHGAAWTFVTWGLLHGVALAAERFGTELRFFKRIPRWVGLVTTFSFVNLTWIVFRAGSLRDAIGIFRKLADLRLDMNELVRPFLLTATSPLYLGKAWLLVVVVLIILVHIGDWLLTRNTFTEKFNQLVWPVRWAIYFAIIFSILILGNFQVQDFIYLQF